MSEGGGFAGRAGMYFIDLCKGEPRLTEHARCIKARYDSGIFNHSGDKKRRSLHERRVPGPHRKKRHSFS